MSARTLAPPTAILFAILASLMGHAQTFTVLYSFTGGVDGRFPQPSLVRDGAGSLYGVTSAGGTAQAGTVFKIDAQGNETVMYSFLGQSDGFEPTSLIWGSNGDFYGTTSGGGVSNRGTVFKLDSAGSETVLYSFAGFPTDGDAPIGKLVRDVEGNLYGTTFMGGLTNQGTVFKLDTADNETVLHSLGSGVDGSFPWAGLIQDALGNLYGGTVDGGTRSYGTVFRVSPSGMEGLIYNFSITTGDSPYGGLVRDDLGKLYGTTEYNGPAQNGMVYRIDGPGKVTTLYAFAGKKDGANPIGGLVRDTAGNFYGTTFAGGGTGCGGPGCGTVYKLDSTGKETVLCRFSGGQDGSQPEGTLLLDTAGNLYGTTSTGGAYGWGTVFEIKP